MKASISHAMLTDKGFITWGLLPCLSVVPYRAACPSPMQASCHQPGAACSVVQKPNAGWVHSGVRHAKTHSAAIRDEAVRTSGAEGPLGVGLVLQSERPVYHKQRLL